MHHPPREQTHTSDTIFDSLSFYVASYSKGQAYTFVHKSADMEVFFEGEKATEFYEKMRQAQKADPKRSPESMLTEMWQQWNFYAEPRLSGGKPRE